VAAETGKEGKEDHYKIRKFTGALKNKMNRTGIKKKLS
jgi:hypothetical protein